MDNHPVVFYDGVCGLCDRSIQFIIRHDRKRVIRYAALQSDIAHKTLGEHITFDSFIFYENGKAYYRSTAALRVLKTLGGLWSMAYVLMIVPAFIRNVVYDFVARNRYGWFGKFDQCKVPTPGQRSLFID
ncbi:MAG: DCC1-like thiol-disulfide oxidoreductase family protein [Bacteroidota bacterium]